MRGIGTVYRQGGRGPWWIQYWVRGRRVRESSGSDKRSDAVRLLKQRIGDVSSGKPLGPDTARTSFRDLVRIIEDNYAANRRKTDLHRYIVRLAKAFGSDLAVNITSDRLTNYTAARLAERARPATINRELSCLRRAFRLALRAGKVSIVPHFELLREDNTRKGFVEADQLEAVLRHLPSVYSVPVRVAFITGWRLHSEILTRCKHHLDLTNGWLRLDPGETKNRAGRMFPLTAELHDLLATHLQATQEYERKIGRLIPWLFHRNGERIGSFYKVWRKAVRAAGIPGAILHDFRRGAVRNLERAGISRSAAMNLTGHLTESVYRRYAIVDEQMLREAADKLENRHKTVIRPVAAVQHKRRKPNGE
jgi:integrase